MSLLNSSTIVFDMDGVLVDASRSYTEATVATVIGYPRDVLGQSAPDADVEWVHALKRVGGFNNDWDLASALVRGVVSFGNDFDLAAYADALAQAGGGPGSVDALLGPLQDPELLGPGQQLKRYFQEHYLGPGLFLEIYGAEREWYHGPAFIDRETPLVDLVGLAALPNARAIATGRPRREAEYALSQLGWEERFDVLVSHDCAREARQGQKPDPWQLLEAMRRLGESQPSNCVYVGDQPDDMRAAVSAGFRAIGCYGVSQNQDVLLAAGAEALIASVSELDTVL